MLHTPVSDKKTKPETSRFEVEPEPQRLKGLSGWSDRVVQGQNGRLAAMQQAYGNQAVLRMLQTERGRSPAANPLQGRVLQRKCACGNTAGSLGSCTECQKEQGMTFQRKGGADPLTEVPEIVHEVLHSPGQPLDSATCMFMKSQFEHNYRPTAQTPMPGVAQGTLTVNQPGDHYETEADRMADKVIHEPDLDTTKKSTASTKKYDFSQVRVHTDAKAVESAKVMRSIAYTVGENVVFGAGRYTPKNNTGKQLISHELTHVIQQQAMRPFLQRQLSVEAEDESAFEKAPSQSQEMGGEPFLTQGDTLSSTPAPAPPVSPPNPLPPGYKPEAWICGRPLRYPGLNEFFGHAFVAAPPDNYAIIAPLCEPTDDGSNNFIQGTAARKWDNSPDPCDDKAECVVCQPKSGVKDVKKCLRDAFDKYNAPTLHKALGPNSNTLAGTLARTCCDGMSNATPFYSTFIYPGWGDSPAPSRPAKCSSGPPTCS